MTDVSKIIGSVHDHIEDMVDYEVSHIDAGDNYAYLVPEELCASDIIKRLNEEVRDYGVEDHFALGAYKTLADVIGLTPEWRDLEPEELEETVIEAFEMSEGHMYGPFCNRLGVASFHVNEVEIDISDLIEDLTETQVDEVVDGCAYHVSKHGSSAYAYAATDAVWFAVIDVNRFNEYVRYNYTAN